MEFKVQSTGEALRNPVDLEELPTDPAVLPNVGMLYTKDVTGITELFYEDDGGVVTQLTGGGSLLHSLDQAYDDGRIITVDAGAVELQTIAGNKALTIFKGAGVVIHADFDPNLDAIQLGDVAQPITITTEADININDGGFPAYIFHTGGVGFEIGNAGAGYLVFTDVGLVPMSTITPTIAATQWVAIGGANLEMLTATGAVLIQTTAGGNITLQSFVDLSMSGGNDVYLDAAGQMYIRSVAPVGSNEYHGVDDGGARTMFIYDDIIVGSPANPRTVTKYGDLVIVGGDIVLDDGYNLWLDTAMSKGLKWNIVTSRFEFNDDLGIVASNIQISTDYPLYLNGVTKTKYLLWNSGNFFELVGGELRQYGSIDMVLGPNTWLAEDDHDPAKRHDSRLGCARGGKELVQYHGLAVRRMEWDNSGDIGVMTNGKSMGG